ncbi:MAG: multicopper oxidase domain-containing protein [Solirubrobacterales bacterium]
MGPDSVGRRDFLSGAGGLLLCTLAGKKVFLDKGADLPKMAAGVPVPPKVRAAEAKGQSEAPRTLLASTGAGQVREYWIRAEPVRWNIVPTGRDQMMNKPIRGKTTFTAYAYRRYTPGFKSPMGPASIPGPLLEAETGDQIVVHFQNRLPVPVTMHPHGVFYDVEMDGSYKGKFTDPGGFVQKNRTFKYVWEAREGTEGVWLYHDHGPMDLLPVLKGMFGCIIVRPAGAARPDSEFFVALHSFLPVATHLNASFSCINGRAYAGNTPNLRSKVGDEVAFHVIALDNDFHTFHIHGHRWTDADGRVIDDQTLGPGDSYSLGFIEDNPGRWYYHCHVPTHLHMGMNGWYLVDP